MATASATPVKACETPRAVGDDHKVHNRDAQQNAQRGSRNKAPAEYIKGDR
jgi:hypothetical protein